MIPLIQTATHDDLAAWLTLAAEVEPLFGPMVHEASFHAALANNFQRGSAYCIRQDNGPAGRPLLGGLLFSPKPPTYRINWLAVAERARQQGLSARLLQYALPPSASSPLAPTT